MLTSESTVVKDARPAYRPFSVTVSRVRRLSPHFIRVTFCSASLVNFGIDRLDQRVKLLLPLEGHGLSDIGADDEDTILGGNWYERWRSLPDAGRNPFRTYTVRAIRPEHGELDLDMVAHEDGGPAARWLSTAAPGDEVIVVGPDARSIDSGIGIDWHPGEARQLLLVGDETAAPAICAIIESLPAGRAATAFIEVPESADALALDVPDGSTVTWLARGDGPHGSELDPAVRGWIAEHPDLYRSSLSATAQVLEEIDVDRDLLWDSPETPAVGNFYAWLAGESAVIKTLRRFLVSETGIDRKKIAFMGYWRLGKAEAQ